MGTMTRSSQGSLADIMQGKPLAANLPTEDTPALEPVSLVEDPATEEVVVDTTIYGTRTPYSVDAAPVVEEQQLPAAEAGAAAPDASTLTHEQAITLADDSKITVDGKITTWGEYQKSSQYSNYQKVAWELNDTKKKLEDQQRELETTKKDLEEQKQTVGKVFSDPFTAAAAALRLTGLSEEEALAGAAAATNRKISGANEPVAPTGPPKPGTEEWYLQDPQTAGLDPASSEYADLWLKHPAALAVAAARKENAAFEARLKADRDAEQKRLADDQKKQQVQTAAQQAQVAENRATWDAMIDDTLKGRKGIDPTKLDQSQRDIVLATLAEAGKGFLNGDIRDPLWNGQNRLKPSDVVRMVETAALDPKLFTRSTIAQTTSEQITAPAQVVDNGKPKSYNRPITAGGASASGGGDQTGTPANQRPLRADEATSNFLQGLVSNMKPLSVQP